VVYMHMPALPNTPRGYILAFMIPEISKRARHRSSIIEGQIKGLQKMIKSNEYCVDILTQSLAVQKSLRSLNKLILENHIKTHVKEGMNKGSGKERDKLTEELLELYELSNVRS